jgi:GT2 family glycosyltransferase
MTIHGGFEPTSNASLSTSDTAFDHDVTQHVTVVVCVYTEQRWHQIVRAVESVLAQQTPADQIVVVVDHNDALLDRARTAFPEATVVASTGPLGLSGARNTGVAHANGEIIAFLDDDAEAEPDWLARMLPHYRNSNALAVGGQAIPAWEAARPRWLPREFDWVVGCSFTGQPSRVSPVRNVIGCNMSFRRAVLDHVNGFDPALGRVGSIPVGCEETELCIRIRQHTPDGIVLYEPRARVRHRVTADRATWRYFRRRCFSEGRSKAVVARLVGSDAALSAEREYIRHALPVGIWRGLRDVRDGDPAGLLRSSAIVAGLLATAFGYASAHALRVSRAATSPARPRSGARPAPVRVLTVELSEGVPAVSDQSGPNGGYGAAQVLVRLHGKPLGVLDIELPAGGLTAQAHAAAIAEPLSEAIDEHLRDDGLSPLDWFTPQVPRIGTSCFSRRSPAEPSPLVSVVIPTCGRAPDLGRTLDSLAAQDYPNLEVVVVDNAPDLESTARLIAERTAREPRVRYASEPRAGVTHARNRGLAEAKGQIVAFADDDVAVDRQWLRALVDGFTDKGVAAVTGQVLASELETPAQIWIEQYGGFCKGSQRRKFDRRGFETVEEGKVQRVVATPGSLYPYLPGTYGTGANMAFRTAVLRKLGGFDPRLCTGEDIDVLMRLVLAGHALVYEPAAIVWHAHRREIRALRRTIFHYGVGLSAVMAKCLATDAAGRRALLRRLPSGIALALNPHSAKNDKKQDGYPAMLTALELCGMALGPVYYAAAAWSMRSGRRDI